MTEFIPFIILIFFMIVIITIIGVSIFLQKSNKNFSNNKSQRRNINNHSSTFSKTTYYYNERKTGKINTTGSLIYTIFFTIIWWSFIIFMFAIVMMEGEGSFLVLLMFSPFFIAGIVLIVQIIKGFINLKKGHQNKQNNFDNPYRDDHDYGLEDVLEQNKIDEDEYFVRYCANCGANLRKTDDFCPKCGNKVEKS